MTSAARTFDFSAQRYLGRRCNADDDQLRAKHGYSTTLTFAVVVAEYASVMRLRIGWLECDVA